MTFRDFDTDRNETDVSHWQAGGHVWSGEQMYGERRFTGPFTGVGPRNYHPSDEFILDEIARRLTWAGNLDAHDINVNVEEGEVTLTGSVNSRKEKRMAEDISESVAGVVDIHNELKINQTQSQPQQQTQKQAQ